MIQFTKLVINNFLSWGENQTLQLNKQGVVLVEGRNLDESGADSNMAGKSSIMEAILWCLYGRTIRNVRHDAVVNRFHKRDCFVTTHFYKGDIAYRVSRYRRHKQHKNKLLLWRGERVLTYRHEADTQNKLESILGCDYQSFTHTTIFGGPRSFALLTDAEQKKILESFLHFEKFDIALRRTKDLLSETIEKEHEYEIRTIRLQGRVQEIRGRLGSLTRAEAVGKRESKQERTEIKRRLKKILKDCKETETPKKKELEGAGEEVENLVTSLAKAGTRRKLLRRHLEALEKSLHDRRKMIGKPCPVCGQKVVGKTMKSFVDHVKEEGRTTKKQLREIAEKISAIQGRLSYARSHLKRIQNKHKDLEDQNIKIRALQGELEKRLKKLAAGSPTPFNEEIQKLSLKYSKAVSRLLLLQFEKKSLEQRIKDLKFWVYGFGNQGVKSLVIREALPAMNSKLRDYAKQIYNGTVEMRFEPTKKTRSGDERELFHLKYKSRFGSASYSGESSGGRRRVDVCVLLVFSWLSSTSNLLLVDELLDGLDSSGRESILRILSGLRGTVLVVTHEKELKAKFEKVWTVVKKKGVSHMEKAA